MYKMYTSPRNSSAPTVFTGPGWWVWLAVVGGVMLESTCDAGILWMVTVVDVPCYVRALSESSFCACAFQIVHLDWAPARTEMGHHLGGFRQVAAHLPAHHLRIRNIPSVIAHGSPFSSQVNLHTALAAINAPNQPDGTFRREKGMSLCACSNTIYPKQHVRLDVVCPKS